MMSEEAGEPIIADRFEAIEEGNDIPFLRFDLVENKRSNRPDLHAMIRLDEWFPSNKKQDIIAGASHDQIWLDTAEEDIEKLTDEQILELLRCGVFYDSDNDSLTMFV